MKIKDMIRDIPDFPKKGILFKDITTLINDKKAFRSVINKLARVYKDKKLDYIVAAESRGFIFAAPLAYKLNCGFVPIRKPGKLPAPVYKESYSLEYGINTIEMHKDAFPKGSKVLVLDDLLATGGTALAMTKLLKKLQAKIQGIAFIVELDFLGGRKKFKNYPIFSLIHY
ncbi:MAG: adenine phosphoribosyltransferase [Candidatus Omnitrophica bacterium]|nr:adenine phosphoribosyltransferase [Candidatus Omnitrophota bacterium]MDD5080948.1 adenine phosphoribosyltransferase [Candidatus Omnitrophota bacterium]MDD5440591.1 adenine phosphoribosyltransferase [Candidatus Omnitrophota bacterium]